MGQSQAAAGMDRLPWLADEPTPRARRGRSALLASTVGAVALVAGASYWVGVNSGNRAAPEPPARSATTVSLPPAETANLTQPQVRVEPVPEVEPMVAPPMPVIDEQERVPRPLIKPAPIPQPTDDVKSTAKQDSVAAAPAETLEPWPARVVEGASGRLVRVGAFATARKAKKGWWAIVRMNPSLKRLPALVVPVRSLRDGRTYYRLQMGTTSQAHSEVLCQRMRMIGQGCVVIGVGGQAESAS